MNPLFRPVSLALIAISVVAGVLELFPLAAMGAVLWVAVIALMSIQDTARKNAAPQYADLSVESRQLVRPLSVLREQIERLVEQNSDVTVVKVIGKQALDEANNIVSHALKLAEIRTELQKSLVSIERDRASLSILKAEGGDLETGESEHAGSLENHLQTIRETTATVDKRLQQAQLVLAELKTKIAESAVGGRANAIQDDSLEEMISRLKSLGKSLDESEAMVVEQRRT